MSDKTARQCNTSHFQGVYMRRRLLRKQKCMELDNKWVKIEESFPDRTDSMVKIRFDKLQR
jgi:hypothetical protein